MIDRINVANELLKDIETIDIRAYESESIPYKSDEIVGEFVRNFMQASKSERQQIISLVSRKLPLALFAFSRRVAVLAVRDTSRERIIEGLVALVIEGVKFDIRETLCSLALLHHSAEKIGLKPKKLFKEATSYYKNDASKPFIEFLSRSPENRSIKAMGYRESLRSEGFIYEWN